MRLGKLVGVALIGATMALAAPGQAGAVQTFNLTTTLTPQNSIFRYAGDDLIARGQTLTVRSSAPVTGFVSTLLDVNVYKYLNGKYYETSDWTMADEVVLNNQSVGRFQIGCGGYYSSPIPSTGMAYICENARTPILWINLSNLTQTVTVNIKGWSPTPEPSTWALMILGFGGIGAAMRRRASAGRVTARVSYSG
ncbi:MAG: PEP-CTERM sorting domain-containing protein [Sphingobium sp.]|nr:PEP-CTERM sorting domain-containing protein [Sphingobium sp.]MBP6112691.1 PEP-CTERM sorting domain-containing protein [Sphingobium sp.]MBP8672022.1 PEP-CTERM sorting domain-containing protein [Sphingobium sp.]MBP9158427.1 PEP-CTERM sorting domain-containing protein [Sphingobium sp.]MCC6480993.1 PEP-CTERM sorting domain-containing protein [Sphingomonadaceae bacterium]